MPMAHSWKNCCAAVQLAAPPRICTNASMNHSSVAKPPPPSGTGGEAGMVFPSTAKVTGIPTEDAPGTVKVSVSKSCPAAAPCAPWGAAAIAWSEPVERSAVTVAKSLRMVLGLAFADEDAVTVALVSPGAAGPDDELVQPGAPVLSCPGVRPPAVV